MDVMITAERDLTPRHDREIMELQQAAFPESADFAHQRWYATPLGDDLWLSLRQDGRLIACVRLVPRRIRVGQRELDIAGIANVCSRPDVRGTGAGKAVMQAVEEYLRTDGKFDFGMLFCNPNVREFYTRFGWREIDNEMISKNTDGASRRWNHDGSGFIMICPGRMPLDDWPAGEIDLNGPIW